MKLTAELAPVLLCPLMSLLRDMHSDKKMEGGGCLWNSGIGNVVRRLTCSSERMGRVQLCASYDVLVSGRLCVNDSITRETK